MWAAEARAGALLDAIPDGILTLDSEGIIQTANGAAGRIFDYPVDDLTGHNLTLIVPTPGRGQRDFQLTHLLECSNAGNVGQKYETQGRRRTGEIFPLELSLSPVNTLEPLLFVGMVRDLSERKRAEQRLADYAKELERSNQELEQFAYIASHDLQEPLRMVASFTELFARRYADVVDDTGREFLGFAVEGAKRMKTLINDLLDYSRLAKDGQSLQQVDCNLVLEQVMQTLRLAINDSKAQISSGQLPCIHGNPSQLRQLFYNLLSNAIKYRDKDRPPCVRIDAQRLAEDWRFCVTDNGIGIDTQHRERIFMLFQRAHRNRHYPGTGIGLAVCKKIVELHGGRIWVESEPNVGSQVFVTMPQQTA